MKVCKYEKIKDESDIKLVVDNIQKEQPYVVVIPTLVPIQEWLQKISISWFHDENAASHNAINELTEYCCSLADRLIKTPRRNEELKAIIRNQTSNMHHLAEDNADLLIDKIIKAEGYRLSCNLFIYFLREQGRNAKILDTEEYMQINMERKPDIPYIQQSVKQYIADNQDADLFVAPLSLCRNVYGETDFMSEKRNDYYATALAVIFTANEVILNTEINNIYTSRSILRNQHSLTYEEAENLINSGVNLLYADCITLAAHSNLVIRVMDMDDLKTEKLYISSNDTKNAVKAILVQDSVTFVRFKSLDVLPGYLLTSKVLDVIEKYKVHVISMASSNVSISMVLTISRDSLGIIQRELRKYAEMIVDENISVVHIIGSLQWEQMPIESGIIETIKSIPISQISYGSSEHCLTLAVHTIDKKKLVDLLSQHYFSEQSFQFPFIVTNILQA